MAAFNCSFPFSLRKSENAQKLQQETCCGFRGLCDRLEWRIIALFARQSNITKTVWMFELVIEIFLGYFSILRIMESNIECWRIIHYFGDGDIFRDLSCLHFEVMYNISNHSKNKVQRNLLPGRLKKVPLRKFCWAERKTLSNSCNFAKIFELQPRILIKNV